MPDWDANWVDVRFDHLAAVSAVDTLWRASRLLDDQAIHRDEAARHVIEEWRGPRHDQWLEDYWRLRRDSQLLSSRLRGDAIAIESAAQEARREQQLREDARMVWLRERAAEQPAVQPVAVERKRHAPIAW